MKKIIVILTSVLVMAGIVWSGYFYRQNFYRNADTGNAVEKQNLIRVKTPKPNDKVESPLAVEGEARGYWFFEASFPVRLFDAAGKELAVGIAQAQDEWMTENFVPFKTTLTFQKPLTDRGTLVLEKDNPSGLPEHADELRIPVMFDLSAQFSGACKPTGCSGQICSDLDVVTTCEFRAEYVCYKNALCQRQADGKCGWTRDEELVRCLQEAVK